MDGRLVRSLRTRDSKVSLRLDRVCKNRGRSNKFSQAPRPNLSNLRENFVKVKVGVAYGDTHEIDRRIVPEHDGEREENPRQIRRSERKESQETHSDERITLSPNIDHWRRSASEGKRGEVNAGEDRANVGERERMRVPFIAYIF